MSRRKLTLVASLALIACLVFALAAPALAEEGAAEPAPISEQPEASPDGIYAVVGKTNTGKQVATNVMVTTNGERIQFRANVMGVPLTTSGVGQWNAERTEVTVPVSVYVIGLADGSGSITLIAKDSGWDFFGTGNGQVLSKAGSATATGFKPGGGTPPTPELIADATGVSETAQSLDAATEPLQPSDPQPEIDTADMLSALAAILFAVFLVIILELILGLILL